MTAKTIRVSIHFGMYVLIVYMYIIHISFCILCITGTKDSSHNNHILHFDVLLQMQIKEKYALLYFQFANENQLTYV